MMGTAMVESGLQYVRQLGGGPAQGLGQMEPATEIDIWDNFLATRPIIRQKLEFLCHGQALADPLVYNVAYAFAMMRLHYWRVPEKLPSLGDDIAFARYWKQHYNTALGKGTLEKFLRAYRKVKVS